MSALINPFNGMQVIVSPHALEDTDVRTFPISRYRSKRLHKKLVKRFGGEFGKRPCIWKMGDKLVMHPVRYAQFTASLKGSAS